MAQGGARRINACHDRDSRAIGNRIGRYVGDGVDDATHRILLWRFRARSREKEMESFVSRKRHFHKPIYRYRLQKPPFASSELEYYLDLGTGAIRPWANRVAAAANRRYT